MSEQPEVVEAAPAAEVVPAERTEVVHVQGTEPAEAMLWRHFRKVGVSLAQSDFVPRAYKGKPDEIMACLAYGHEIGMGPMVALQSINVIQGKPTLSAEAMRSLIRKAGHSLNFVEYTDERVTIHGKRADSGDEATVTFSMEDARRAGLTGNATYQKYPRGMCSARASAEIGRVLFSDVLMGMSYTPEEMGSVEPALGDARERVLRDVPDGAEGDDDIYEGMPMRREPPVKIVQSDPQHAGRVVLTNASPPVRVESTVAGDSPRVDGPWLCAACGHPVTAHSTIRRGCNSCACTNTWAEDEAEIVGVASPDQGEGSAAAVAVNDGRNPVEAEPPPPEPSDDETGPPPAVVGDPTSSAHADPTQQAEEAGPLPNPASEAQFRRIHASLKDNDLGDDARHCIISFVTGMRTTSSRELTSDEATVVLNLIGQVRLGRLSVEQRDGEWVVYATDDAGVRFLKQTERRVQPSRGRGGVTRPADEGTVEPLSEDERAGAI